MSTEGLSELGNGISKARYTLNQEQTISCALPAIYRAAAIAIVSYEVEVYGR